MAFSSGTFTLNEPDVVTGTTISSSWANSVLGDIATNGLTVCITKNGQSTVTANIPFAGFRLTNIGAPTTAADALREGSAIGAVSAAAITGTAVSGTSFVAGGTSLTAFAAATVQLTIGGTGATSVFAIPGTLEATGTTGALTVAGGVYVAKASNLTGVVTLGGALVGPATATVFNTVSTTVNAFGAASVALNIGHASGTNTVLGATTFSQAATLTSAIPQLTLGVLNTTSGGILMYGSTSGSLTLKPAAAAGAGVTITFPATSVTLNAAGDLTGTTLAAGVTASSLTSLGTIAALVAGTISTSGAVIVRNANTGDVQLTLGSSPSDNWSARIDLLSSFSEINWQISQNTPPAGSGGFAITPSTAGGGSTFTTAALKISNAGAVTIPGTLAVTGAITGASYSGGAISGTTGAFSGASITLNPSSGNASLLVKPSAAAAFSILQLGDGVTNNFYSVESDTNGLYFKRNNSQTLVTLTDTIITMGLAVKISGDNITGVSAGSLRASEGLRIGTDSTNNLIDDASTGAGTATLYIGNASINVTSDENLKFNIQPFKSGLELVKQLQPIEFDQDEMRPFGHIRHYVGFGARAVHKVAPWAVHTQGNTGLPWQARYEFLMAPVVGAVQELDSRLAAIEAKLH